MASNIRILKCTAEYGKTYYVELGNRIRECRLIATASDGKKPYYILDVAGLGETMVNAKDEPFNDRWWNTSRIESVLAETPEDLTRKKFLTDWYGSTSNAYNSKFIEPFFPNYIVCGCGGGIHFWEWNGIRPELYSLNGKIRWRLDRSGFHCMINEMSKGRYKTKEECIKANRSPEVVRFNA